MAKISDVELWIRIKFNADPDPAFYLDASPDPEPNQYGSLRIWILAILLSRKKLDFYFKKYTECL